MTLKGHSAASFVVVVAVCLGAVLDAHEGELPTLADAQGLFYNAQDESAARLTHDLHPAETEDLASDELRSSALIRALGHAGPGTQHDAGD